MSLASQPGSALLGWPTRGQTGNGVDAQAVTAAWDSSDGRAHHRVRLLYTGTTGQVRVAVAEGIDSAGAGRLAVRTIGDKAGAPSPLCRGSKSAPMSPGSPPTRPAIQIFRA